jgi:sodium transport system permease protein
MYSIPLIGQQLTLMRLLRGESIAAAPLILSTVMTIVALVALFIVAQRIYQSERLAINA